jgi:hypothetical protein
MRWNSVIIGLAVCFAAGSAQADLLTNGGFESPVVTPGGEYQPITINTTVTTAGWTWTNLSGVINGSVSGGGFNGPDLPAGYVGAQYAYLQSNTNIDPNTSSLSQTFTLTAASDVTITWLAAGRPNLGIGFDGNTTYDVTAGSLSFSGTTTTASDFVAESLSGVLAAGTYTLTFLNNAPTGDHTMYLDNVVVSASDVPEPASLSVLAFGVAALVRSRRGVGSRSDGRALVQPKR